MSELTEPPIRLAICIPWGDTVQAVFARCFAQLYGQIVGEFVAPGLADLALFTVNGTYLAQERMELTVAALQWGATHLLWLDSDMEFPKYTFLHLVKQVNPAHPIIGVNYARRRPPYSPVTFKTLPTDGSPEALCYTEESSTGLEEVDAIGFGVVLMLASVFEQDDQPGIPLPGFRTHFDKGQAEGEDAYFCREAKKYGHKVFIDHDLSKQVGHVGTATYRVSTSVAARPERLIVPVGEMA